MGHLRTSGLTVKAENLSDVTPIKVKHGVPQALHSCHTAVVNGYVIEGHVPADTIKRLVKERPAIAGLAVPGMPAGSPGMETPGVTPQRYQVMSFEKNGRTAVFENR